MYFLSKPNEIRDERTGGAKKQKKKTAPDRSMNMLRLIYV